MELKKIKYASGNKLNSTTSKNNNQRRFLKKLLKWQIVLDRKKYFLWFFLSVFLVKNNWFKIIDILFHLYTYSIFNKYKERLIRENGVILNWDRSKNK